MLLAKKCEFCRNILDFPSSHTYESKTMKKLLVSEHFFMLMILSPDLPLYLRMSLNKSLLMLTNVNISSQILINIENCKRMLMNFKILCESMFTNVKT